MELCSLPAIYLGPNYGEGNKDNGDLPQKIPCMYYYSPCSQICSRPPRTPAFTGDSWTPTGKSPVGSPLFLSPGFWCTRLCLCSPRVFPPVLCKFWQLCGVVNGDLFPKGLIPYPGLLHPELLSLQQSTANPYLHRRHSNTVLSQSLWGPWVLVCTRFV